MAWVRTTDLKEQGCAVYHYTTSWLCMFYGKFNIGGGVRKSDGVPEHKSHEQVYTSHEERGDKESSKACTRLKSCESLYMCPRAPFYRETKGLLNPETTLESREYS
jgi:hypothetical protein